MHILTFVRNSQIVYTAIIYILVNIFPELRITRFPELLMKW